MTANFLHFVLHTGIDRGVIKMRVRVIKADRRHLALSEEKAR